jgi:hypothetical protein
MYQFYLASIAKTDGFGLQIYSIIIPLIAVFIYLVTNFDAQSKTYMIGSAVIFAVVFLIIYIFVHFNIGSYLESEVVRWIMTLLVMFVALSIVYNIFANNLRKFSGWTGFFINLVFYLPCLLSDLITYLRAEVTAAPPTLYILFVLELALLLAYFYLIPFVQRNIAGNAMVLLNEPVMLSKKKFIDHDFKRSAIFKVEKPAFSENIYLAKPATSLRRKWALSLWVYLNAAANSKLAYSQPTTIFCMTDDQGHLHPKMVYDNTDGQDRCIITVSDNTTTEITLPKQRWNNLTFNYVDNRVDVFVNGEIERTVNFAAESMPVYTEHPMVYVGPDTNGGDGLYGSICNVVYYPEPLTKLFIVNKYNYFAVKNPPMQ